MQVRRPPHRFHGTSAGPLFEPALIAGGHVEQNERSAGPQRGKQDGVGGEIGIMGGRARLNDGLEIAEQMDVIGRRGGEAPVSDVPGLDAGIQRSRSDSGARDHLQPGGCQRLAAGLELRSADVDPAIQCRLADKDCRTRCAPEMRRYPLAAHRDHPVQDRTGSSGWT